MPVRVLNFLFPVAVFLCCCDRGFILLCVQDSKSEFYQKWILSSSYYKGLQSEHQEGRQESCLSVTAEHSTPKVLPSQSSKYCKSAGVMSSTTPAEAGDMQEPHVHFYQHKRQLLQQTPCCSKQQKWVKILQMGQMTINFFWSTSHLRLVDMSHTVLHICKSNISLETTILWGSVCPWWVWVP